MPCEHGLAFRKCSPCTVERVRQWRLRNPGRRERYKPADGKRYLIWVHANADRHSRIQKNSRLKKFFGITLEDYERMFQEQDGKCAICSKPQGNNKRLAVDHNHKTGKVRGLLCWICNSAIGKFHDDPLLLNKASDYLIKHDGI